MEDVQRCADPEALDRGFCESKIITRTDCGKTAWVEQVNVLEVVETTMQSVTVCGQSARKTSRFCARLGAERDGDLLPRLGASGATCVWQVFLDSGPRMTDDTQTMYRSLARRRRVVSEHVGWF